MKRENCHIYRVSTVELETNRLKEKTGVTIRKSLNSAVLKYITLCLTCDKKKFRHLIDPWILRQCDVGTHRQERCEADRRWQRRGTTGVELAKFATYRQRDHTRSASSSKGTMRVVECIAFIIGT
uniref:Uncharacterized protein n=1 Tax=Cacopsylla melanoneura TaxID=428564 RepID=A0A8D9EDR6_9HEMI